MSSLARQYSEETKLIKENKFFAPYIPRLAYVKKLFIKRRALPYSQKGDIFILIFYQAAHSPTY
ncbi:hypothetical protein SOASR015_01880 [Pectobacterium carotovorum subsp. carotovorum]|nr:hypothetical protein SOASR015_01880 [Pectobacterium carotovorum subsp. carotovorum]GLX56663.1 hypothetical protein Pcaca02_19720 [Pectobacterium carotovorum subsp. carotovorum]